MNKRIFFGIFILMAFLFVSACSNNTDTKRENNTRHSFSIYLVKDLTADEALKKDIDTLTLEDNPVLTDRNISEYNWPNHEIKIIRDENLINNFEQRVIMKVPTTGKAFVLKCNEDRVYMGCFWTSLSSLFGPKCPTISSDSIVNDTLTINNFPEKKDVRTDKRIYDTLKALNKLKE